MYEKCKKKVKKQRSGERNPDNFATLLFLFRSVYRFILD